MNTEEAFTPEQVTEVVGALHNATMDKWLGAGLTLVIGAVVIKIVSGRSTGWWPNCRWIRRC